MCIDKATISGVDVLFAGAVNIDHSSASFVSGITFVNKNSPHGRMGIAACIKTGSFVSVSSALALFKISFTWCYGFQLYQSH